MIKSLHIRAFPVVKPFDTVVTCIVHSIIFQIILSFYFHSCNLSVESIKISSTKWRRNNTEIHVIVLDNVCFVFWRRCAKPNLRLRVFAWNGPGACFIRTGVHRGYLLGDTGYPFERYLKTPFLNTSTAPQQRLNASLYKFGILKRRFSCFQGCFKILWSLIQSRTNPNQATRYVIACMCHLAQYWYKQGWHRRFYTRSSSTSRWKREQHRSWRWC